MTEPDDETRVELTLRVPRRIKARLAAYAKSRSLTLNAAGIVFLDEHLPAEPGGASKRKTRST